MTKDEEDFRKQLERDGLPSIDKTLTPDEINYILEDRRLRIKKAEWEIERKEIQIEYDERRPIIKQFKNQFRRIKDATGIPTEWINTFAKSSKKPYADGWDRHECMGKINGITKWGNPANRNASINNCIEELVNSISQHRRHIKGNYRRLAPNPKKIYTEFDPFYLNQINGICKDKLYKKIKSEIPKAKKQEQKKNLETFIRKWRANAKKEARENFSRIKGDVDVEEFVSIYQVKKEHPLSKLISQKDGQEFFKRTKMEGETIEFKDSFFANLERVEEEWNDIQNNEKRKGSVPKTIEEWMKIKDGSVQFGILKCVCSFLNTDGGKIWLGVSNDGKIIGISNVKKREQFKDLTNFDIVDSLRLTLTQALQNTFPEYYDTHIETNTPELRPGQSDDKQLVVIDVQPTYPADATIPRHGRDEAYHRVGSECLPFKTIKEFINYRKKRGDKAPKKKKS